MLLSDAKTSLAIDECFVFFSFLRVKFHLQTEKDIASVNLLKDGQALTANIGVERRNPESTCVTIEAIIDPEEFPAVYAVAIEAPELHAEVGCADLVQHERLLYQRTSMTTLKSAINRWYVANNSRRARILDIGGRARSGTNLKGEFKNCDFKILDIMGGDDVDYVADAHSMSETLDGQSFDIVCSTSTFEHLVMPWKAALEMNKVLTLGGYAFVVTHQCVGMHDLPHDYFRFSSDSWKGIFNADTGFQIVETAMNDFVRLVPMHFYNIEPGFERAGGFIESMVLAKKIGESKVAWPVDARSIETTQYPA